MSDEEIDPNKIQMADCRFGTTEYRGLKTTVAVAVIDGKLHVGNGETKLAALQAAFRAAYPNVEFKLAPGAAWSDLLT
jgi:hypothetical protein